MSERNGTGGALLAAAALIACCALPLLVVTAGGAMAAAGGLAARYWPLTALGIALVAWAGVKLAKLVRARSRSLQEPPVRRDEHGGRGRPPL